jgi:hypothetical protein
MVHMRCSIVTRIGKEDSTRRFHSPMADTSAMTFAFSKSDTNDADGVRQAYHFSAIGAWNTAVGNWGESRRARATVWAGQRLATLADLLPENSHLQE